MPKGDFVTPQKRRTNSENIGFQTVLNNKQFPKIIFYIATFETRANQKKTTEAFAPQDYERILKGYCTHLYPTKKMSQRLILEAESWCCPETRIASRFKAASPGDQGDHSTRTWWPMVISWGDSKDILIIRYYMWNLMDFQSTNWLRTDLPLYRSLESPIG